MLGNKLINTNAGGGCTNTVDLYNPFPDGGGVALYQLNGNATDVSGNYNGTATAVTYGAGEFGQAGVFNGSSSIIDLPNNSFNFSTVSVSFWLKLNSITGEDYVLDVYDEASGQARGYAISTDASNKIKFRAWDWVNFAEVFSSSTLSLNTWYYIAMVATQTSASIYINGSLDNSGSLNGFSFQAQQSTSIGAFRGTIGGGSAAFLDGSLDQVRIFNRALRPYEVEALYTEEYCTPTIVPSEHFNTVLYSGNSGTQSITSVGFAPDLTWIKERTGTDHHRLQDTVRGAGYRLYSSTTSAEGYTNDSITSFDANGFSLGSSLGVNESGQNYVAWNFKAGGAAVTNTDGTITSQVSANTEAGFSIVTFTGTGSTASVGHGLGQKPSIIFTKNRSASEGWFTQQYMYIPSGNAAYGYLNTTAAFTGFTDSITNDTVMQQGGTNGQNYVSYCFAEVEGFSSIGSYVGTGTSKTVVTGFEPAFVMFKVTSEADHWLMFDNKRGVVTDSTGTYLIANLSQAEGSILPDNIRFLQNGFEITGSGTYWNKANASYIYMAFAADPTAVEPTLEDSFNTVTYTGNRGTKEVTGIGFQPDFVWIKNRDAIASNFLHDTVRGKNNNYYESLISNGTFAESTTNQAWHDSYGWISDIYDGGFTVNQGSVIDDPSYNNTQDYVAWNWKGAEIPAINSNGSIPSVVSANPAAGFSIVSYTGNNIAGATIGHGLGVEPDVIIVKNRDTTDIWTVQHSALTYTDYIDLSSSNAATTNTAVWYAQPTSEVFSFGANPRGNGSGNKIIAYCFAEVAGFSKFGSYLGGTANKKIITDFEPAFIMFKRTNISGENWVIYDNKRSPLNPRNDLLLANTSNSEFTDYFTHHVNFDSDGFTLVQTSSAANGSGDTYIYMAFANQF